MSATKARIGPSVLTLIIAFGTLSCENLRRADNADGLLDFLLLAVGRGQSDIAFIEKVTTGGGEIATARAVASGDRASVFGSLKRQSGAGWISAAYSHVDVIVLGGKREIVQTEVVTFSPSEIPASARGIQGRSHFSASIRRPAAGSVIRVVFHSVSRKKCQFYEDDI